ncbi:hypothetical protein ABW21_db0207406 [Orbilia brochopaga]|nr:hypothetical protein ABW21_db0207406 [Drechslerella brochopaga]
MVKQLGGSIDFFSTLGIGSVFKITFPFLLDPNATLPDDKDKKVDDLLQVTSAILQKDFIQRRRTSDPLSLRLPESDGDEEKSEAEDSQEPVVESTVETVSLAPVVTHTAPSPTTEPKRDGTVKKRPQYSPLPGRTTGPRRENSRDSVSSIHSTTSGSKGVKVMVVEDNWALQNITKLRLERLGCQAIIAPNGIDALRLLSSKLAEPDLILMDLQMPLMDGYDATKNIRSAAQPGLEQFQHIPIIAVTASTLEEDKEKAFKVGMSDYVFKPLGMNVLKELLAKYSPCAALTTAGITHKEPNAAT